MSTRNGKIELHYYVIPTFGQFKITVTIQKHPYDNSKILHTTLNVGGPYDKCVNITIPPPDTHDNKELKLSWAEVQKKQCTVNSQVIRGSATVEMVNLAFTIAQEIAPYAEYVTFDDMSFFIVIHQKVRKKLHFLHFT